MRDNVFSGQEKHEGILGDAPWLTETAIGARLKSWTGPDGVNLAEWANRLHFKTQREVIERELLFKEGEPLNPWLLEETERNLRELGFLRNAYVSDEITGPGHARVTVLTQDAWTLDPLLAFSVIGGGHFSGQAGLAEDNLFGFGKSIQFYRSSERFRDVDFVGYEDPRLWGTHWHLMAEGSEDSDGRVRSALLEYPFWALGVPYSTSDSFGHIIDQERLFSQNGNLFRHWQTAAAFEASSALESSDNLVRRIGLRYQLWDDSFGAAPVPSADQAVGLEGRRTSAVMLTFTEWHPDFVKAYYLDQLGRPEDRDVGSAIKVRIGYSPTVMGASSSELVFGSSASFGGRIRDLTYGWLWLQASGREGAGAVRDGFVTIEGIGYQRLGLLFDRNQTLVLDARADLSSGLFRDHEFVVGTDDGQLRGYPIDYRAGTQRMLFHVEDRLALVEDLLHLVSVGCVAFVDAGQVWGRGTGLSWDNMLASVGVGLRLAGTRSSLQIPIRLDFAFPLIHHSGVSWGDFETGAPQLFGTFGQPYAAEQNSITDPENFAPDSTASPYPNASPFTYPGSSFTQY
ncbi:MAG: BamA/TamA family outer membrane protein [Candidatus Binataceae bacterium]